MKTEPELFDVDVDGGTLRVARWGRSGPLVVAIHGITASHLNFRAIVAHLPDDLTVVAPDLRGRGGSGTLPGPYGMDAHVRDMVALLDHLGVEKATVAGMSMGGYVAAALAAEQPERVDQVVLIDGGLSLPVPPGLDPDQVLDTMLGPAIERLRKTFASADEYIDMWRAHPAFTAPGHWNEHTEAYVRYDLTGSEPELRSKVSEEAVRTDGRDLLTNEAVRTAVARITCPVRIIRATRGIQNEPTPVQPDILVDEAKKVCPQLLDEVVDDTNHYSLVMADRPAAVVAQRIAETVGVLSAR